MDTLLLLVVIVVALGFDFTNGFHDTANAVATSVSTRALTPRVAVLIAAIANLAGAFVTTAVAKTVGQGIIDTSLAIASFGQGNDGELYVVDLCGRLYRVMQG